MYASGQRLDVEGLGVLAIDAVPDPAEQGQVAEPLRVNSGHGHQPAWSTGTMEGMRIDHTRAGDAFDAGLDATWAVELAVHHLDLRTGSPDQRALRLARETVEALAEENVPREWDDIEVVLRGTGRTRPALAVGWAV
ncbi:hypothetical protein Acsp02_64980 [Actinoplanes sp. NBRC 103695]|nr:hypothetical protein Acsp02_64980 [Actinoplanes sp. NBRC 103695]